MLSEEQVKEIKQQLLKQIENFPGEQKEKAREQIEAMGAEQLEEFLVKNKLIKAGKEECVFCSIIKGNVPAYKLAENKSSLAVLEITPLSRGHSLIISKQHNKLQNSAFSLANKLARRIKSKLKPEQVKIENIEILGHQIISVIPIYKNEKLEKKTAGERDLILLQEKLRSKPKTKLKKPVSKQPELLEKAPRRIP